RNVRPGDTLQDSVYLRVCKILKILSGDERGNGGACIDGASNRRCNGRDRAQRAQVDLLKRNRQRRRIRADECKAVETCGKMSGFVHLDAVDAEGNRREGERSV